MLLIDALNPDHLKYHPNERSACSCHGELSVDGLKPEFVVNGPFQQFVSGLYCDTCGIGWWQALLVPPVALSAAFGAYSHVVLDSLMHTDIQPFSNFSSTNPLLGVVPLGSLHIALLVLAAVGVTVVGLRKYYSSGGNAG